MADVSVLKVNGTSYNVKDAKKYFLNTSLMKSKSSLNTDDVCQTVGYNSVDDGGGAFYHIVSAQPSSPYVYETLTNGKYAKLIPMDNVNVKACGAVGNGTTDDTASINKAMQLAFETKKEVYFPAGKYLISSAITIPEGISVRGTTGSYDFDVEERYVNASAIDRYSTIVSATDISMFEIGRGTSISYLVFYYSNNLPTLTARAVTKPTITTSAYRDGLDPLNTCTTIHDCFLLNGSSFFKSNGGGKIRIYNIKVDCTDNAIYISRAYDSCYIDNVHVWPFYFAKTSNLYTNYIVNHRCMFFLTECDDIHITSSFGYGGKYGVRCVYPESDTAKGAWVLIDGCSFDYFETTISAVYAKHITVNNSHITQKPDANSIAAVYLENCPLTVFSDIVFYFVNNCFMITNSNANLSNIKCESYTRNLFLTSGTSEVHVSNCDKNYNVSGYVNNVKPTRAAVVYPTSGNTTSWDASTTVTTITIPLTYIGPCCLTFTCPTNTPSTVVVKVGTNSTDKAQYSINLGSNVRGTYNIPLFFYPGASSLHGCVNVYVSYKTEANAPITGVQIVRLGNVDSAMFAYFNSGYTNYKEYCSNFTYNNNARLVFPVETPNVSYFVNGDMYVATTGKIYTKVNNSWLS